MLTKRLFGSKRTIWSSSQSWRPFLVNEELKNFMTFPFCFPMNDSSAVPNQGRPENKPSLVSGVFFFSFFFLLPATQRSQTQAVGIKYMDLPTTKDLHVFCADNKKPFDYNSASPCWDWLMTFRDDGDHFAPKRMLFTKIDLNIYIYIFFTPFDSCLKGHGVWLCTSQT